MEQFRKDDVREAVNISVGDDGHVAKEVLQILAELKQAREDKNEVSK